MHVTSTSFNHGDMIPGDFAFCLPDPETHATFGRNLSPQLAWTDVPAGTKSFAITCIDVDVPTVGDDVNQQGREVPPDLPREDFVHWVVVDIPARVHEIAAGEFAEGVVEQGKDPESGPHGTRQGVNDYTGWFEGDAAMAGHYYGYDGPCPP